jgi:hypothetical protein
MPQVDKVTFFPQTFWLITIVIMLAIFVLRKNFYHTVNLLKTRIFLIINNFELQLKINKSNMTKLNMQASIYRTTNTNLFNNKLGLFSSQINIWVKNFNINNLPHLISNNWSTTQTVFYSEEDHFFDSLEN